MQLTIEVSDTLGYRLQPLRHRLPEILEQGLYEFGSVQPALTSLPFALPLDGAIRIELQQNIPIFRASPQVQERIETLLDKQSEAALSVAEMNELTLYEEI